MEHEGDGYTSFNRSTRCGHRKIITAIGGLGNKSTSKGYPNYSIVGIGQNTQEDPGNLKRTCCHSASSVKPSANAAVKNSQICKKIIILIKGLEELEIRRRVETIEITALLRSAWILRKVLETWRDLLSLCLPCRTHQLTLVWKTLKGIKHHRKNIASSNYHYCK